MSCDQWESGDFKLSVAEYRKFKKLWREDFNAYQDILIGKAVEFWERCKTLTTKQIKTLRYDLENDEQEGFYLLFMKKLPGDLVRSEGRKRPRKPIRKDFPLATNKTTIFDIDDTATVAFVDAERRIAWSVGENNHACERARNHCLGELFFRLLGNVEWTRGTSGKIIGNDEYNRQNDTVGGANYVKSEYGPTIKQRPHRVW